MTEHTISIESPDGVVTARWHREGRMIVIRYGEREQRAKASEHEAANDLIARERSSPLDRRGY